MAALNGIASGIKGRVQWCYQTAIILTKKEYLCGQTASLNQRVGYAMTVYLCPHCQGTIETLIICSKNPPHIPQR